MKTLTTQIGLILALSSSLASASPLVVTCPSAEGSITLTFGVEKPSFKYEHTSKNGESYSFESIPENDWALKHTKVSAEASGDLLAVNAKIASEDSFPSCVVVPGTRRCSSYEPGIGIETIAELKLKHLQGHEYSLEDVGVYHYGSYGLHDYLGATCTASGL